MFAEADLRSSCGRRDVSLVVFRSLSGWDEGSIERRRCTCGCVCVSPKQERKERERKREKKEPLAARRHRHSPRGVCLDVEFE